MSLPDVDVATTHKTLHHKRPHLFPLVDNRTVAAFEQGNVWVTIHGDLQRQTEQFTRLEGSFADLAAAHGGVPLTRLRIHDILLWCAVSPGEWEAARDEGRKVLDRVG